MGSDQAEGFRPLSILMINQRWFADELSAMGHRVITAGWYSSEFDINLRFPGIPISELLAELPKGFSPDCLIFYDDSGPMAVYGLESLNIPSVFYSVDSHHHFDWHKYFANSFDLVLVAQLQYVHCFQETHENVIWFPLWAPLHLEPSVEKSIDVSFRGNLSPRLHPKRARFFNDLAALVPVDASGGGYLNVYPRSKIIVNQAVKNDLNFRVFEALIAGALLLTPENVGGMTDLFTDGEDLVTYRENDALDASNKIKYYLSHEEERACIAASGRNKVLKEHSLEVRAKQLELHLRNLKLGARKRRFLGATIAALTSAKTIGKISNAIATRLLKQAKDLILECAKARECSDTVLAATVFYCKYALEKSGEASLAMELLESISEACPGEIVYRLGQIESLVLSGEHERARLIAEQCSHSPDEVLERIVELMAQIKKQFVLRVNETGQGPDASVAQP